ncbi:hypothetical protein MMC17_004252 [Xylographa soralifera]|nr:hypothetical protein [Xylographa soralifera]
MASLGQLTAALISGSQETSLALASLNFDFSLVKVEAPIEYQGFGMALSKRRKTDAEAGLTHITARKLGALFEEGLPDIPSLNPKGSKEDGPFADHVGADGTTIWAAATSGRGAIAVHLLACMLARIWKAPEAISIWTELVIRRKVALQDQCQTQTFQLFTLEAAQVQLTREQLSAWDASARAWLRTADEAKRLQQTQLTLILKNISLPVTTTADVYSSVMEAWIKAMKSLNNLIRGMPQRIQHGAVLLGLSAWHIYPDMFSLGVGSTMIEQHDPLVNQGGVVTLGFKNADPAVDDGIYWSLPMAYLRYYGDPVIRTASAGDQATRVSLNQLHLVALGSIISTWGKFPTDLATPAGLILAVQGIFNTLKATPPPWLQIVAAASRRFLRVSGSERAEATRLVQFGQRRCPEFISTTDLQPAPVFGLTNMRLLVRLSPTINGKLECLRQASKSFDLDMNSALIRYYESSLTEAKYTRLIPQTGYQVKRSLDGTMKEVRESIDWKSDYHDDSRIRDFDRDHDFIGYSNSNDVPLVLCPPAPGSNSVLYEFVYGDYWTAAVFQPVHRDKHPRPVPNTINIQTLIPILSSKLIDYSRLPAQLCKVSLVPFSKDRRAYFRSLDALDLANKIYSSLGNSTIDLRVTKQPLHCWNWCNIPRDDFDQGYDLADAFSCIASFETGSLNLNPKDLDASAAMAMSYGNSIYVAEKMISDPSEVLPLYAVRRIIGNIGKPGLSLLVPPELPRTRELGFSWNNINHCEFNGKLEDNFAGTSLHLSFSDYQKGINVGSHGQRDQEATYIEAIVSIYDCGEWVADLDILKASEKWRSSGHEAAVNKYPRERKRKYETEYSYMDDFTVSGTIEIDHVDFNINDYITADHSRDSGFRYVEPREKPTLIPEDLSAAADARVRREGDQQYVFDLDTHEAAGQAEQTPIKAECRHTAQERSDPSCLSPVVAIDSWAELLDPPTVNGVVRAWDNKMARLCAAAVAAQKGYNVHVVGKSPCWICDNVDCYTEEQHNADPLRERRAAEELGAVYVGPKLDQHHIFIC